MANNDKQLMFTRNIGIMAHIEHRFDTQDR